MSPTTAGTSIDASESSELADSFILTKSAVKEMTSSVVLATNVPQV